MATRATSCTDAEDDLKKLTGNFDRFAKLTVQKQWGFGDAFRCLPILDAFESPTKIKQIVLPDLPIEYGSFKDVPATTAAPPAIWASTAPASTTAR